MRFLKYTLLVLASLVITGLLALAVVWATFDNEDYRRLAIRGVEYFTGHAMTIDGAFSLSLSMRLTLTAEGIRLESQDGDQPPSVRSIGKLRVQLELPRLLLGTLVVPELEAEDVLLSIAVNDPDDNAEGPFLTEDIDLPVFGSVRLRDIQLEVVDVANARTIPVRLRQFDLDDVNNAGPMFVTGDGTVAGRKFSIDGQMGALGGMLKAERPYPVDYSIEIAGIQVSFAGTFTDYENAEVADLRITGEASETAVLFELVHVETPALGRLQFELAIKGDLSAPQVPTLKVSLSGDPKIQLSVDGSLDNAFTGEGADVDFAGSCTLPAVLRMIRPENLAGLNLLRLSGRLQETDGSLTVENIEVTAVSEAGAEVVAAGRFDMEGDFEALAIKNVDLELKASYPSSDVLRPIVFDRLPEVGPIFARGRLIGPLDALRLEALSIDAGGKGPLRFTTKGLITGKIEGYRLIASAMDLVTTTQSESTAILAEAYKADLPELGTVSARYRMRGNLERFQLEQLVLRTETPRGLKTAWSGRIDFDRGKNPDLRGSLDLRLAVTAPTLGAATAPWDIAYLPGLKGLEAEARIAGTTDVVSLKDIELQVGDRSLMQIRLTGDLETIDASKDQVLAGIDLKATLAVASTAEIFSRQGVRLPELGPLRGSARIRDRQGGIDVEAFKFTGGATEDPDFTASGQMIGLNDPDGMQLKIGFKTASKPWVAAYLGHDGVENVNIEGEVLAKAIANGIEVKKLHLVTSNDAPVKLVTRGTIENLAASPRIALKLDASAADPTAIRSVTGLQIPHLAPVTIKGLIKGKIPSVDFEGKVHVGQSILTARLRTAVSAGRPNISAEIRTQTLDLNEIGLLPGVPPEEVLANAKPESRPGQRLFGKDPLLPFAALQSIDLTLNLDADRLIGRNVSIAKMDVDVQLKEGRLRIQPANVAYAGGATDMAFILDASGVVPTYALTFSGEDMDVDDLLAYANEPIILSGSLNVVADLQSAGISASEVAANLKGSVGLALENGQIWRIVNLLSKDVFDMLLTAADTRTYTEMHCLLGHVSFEKGTGTIDMLYMDSPKMRAKGAGTFNLANETVDLVISPERKRRLFKKRSAVRLKGPLGNPSAASMPLAEAAELYGTITLPVVFLPLRGVEYLYSLLTKDADPTPCVIQEKP